jgi:hypothetical protein
MLRSRLPYIVAGAVLALALSLVLAARSHEGAPTSSGCLVTALTCASGQADPPGSTAPADAKGPALDGTNAPGLHRDRPTTTAPAGPTTAPGATATATTGYPDAHTTGPRLSMRPHSTGALSVRTDGTVISRWDITGSLDVYANNVTVIDSRITSDNWWGINLRSGFSGLRVLHTTITAVPGKGPDNGGVDYGVSNMGTSSVEVGWCDISVFGNSLSMGQGYLHDNFVHDITPFRNQGGEWQHTDPVISDGGNTGQLIIRHNTLLNNTPVDQGASGSVGLFADTGAVRNVTVDGNWLAGGAYALYAGGKGSSGIKVTDNVFSTQYHPNSGGYGAVTAWDPGGAGNEWSNNRMSDGRSVIPQANQ